MITETAAPVPEESPDSGKWLKLSDSPTLSTGRYVNTVLPVFAIEHVLCTHATCVCKLGRQGIHILD